MLLETIQQEFPTLLSILTWLAGGGGAMWLAGKIVARFLENLTLWHKLPMWIKKAIPWVLAGILSTGANLAIEFEALQYVPVWLATTILTMINWYFGQKEYEAIKDSPYGESTRLNAQ